MPTYVSAPCKTRSNTVEVYGAAISRPVYAALMRTLYMVTAGSSDATRATIPLHLAVNGSLEVGHDVGIVLAGDATELLKIDVRQSLEGVGVPPIRDLFTKARQTTCRSTSEGHVPSPVRRPTTTWRPSAGNGSPADVARLIEAADRFVRL